jgi:hypothetical protein
LLKLTGVFVVTRIAETSTSSSLLTEVVSLTCEKERREREKKRDNKKVILCVFAPLWQEKLKKYSSVKRSRIKGIIPFKLNK